MKLECLTVSEGIKKRLGRFLIPIVVILTITPIGWFILNGQTTQDGQTTQETHGGVILLKNFYNHIKNKDFQKAGEMFSPYMIWDISLYGYSDPAVYLASMFDYADSTIEIVEVVEDSAVAFITRDAIESATGFYSKIYNGEWTLFLYAYLTEEQLQEREAFVRSLSEPEQTKPKETKQPEPKKIDFMLQFRRNLIGEIDYHVFWLPLEINGDVKRPLPMSLG